MVDRMQTEMHARAALIRPRRLRLDEDDLRIPRMNSRKCQPFWFTDLVSALDSLSMLGVPADHPPVARAVEWFRSRQREDGSWRLTYLKNVGKDVDLWVHFGLYRALKRYSP